VEIKVITGDITKMEAGAVIVGLFEGVEEPEFDLAVFDKALDGEISKLVKQEEIKGGIGEICVVHTLGRLVIERVVIAGLGKKEQFDQDKLRRIVAEVCRMLSRKSVASVIVGRGGATSRITTQRVGQAVAEGALLGVYSFRRHITKKAEHGEMKELSIVATSEDERTTLEQGVNKGRVIAEAASLARDLVNEPGNYMKPADMAETAQRLAKEYSLELTVLDKDKMTELGMGALLAVSQASHQMPKFIVLSYRGGSSRSINLALVGKGITFDSGGLSLKSPEKMEGMKEDMAGAAAVMAAIGAIARLKPKINVSAMVPAVENLPGGGAYRPGDVLTTMTGITVEVISTDAEGRLILADALGYAVKLKAERIVDVATLTGACITALGDVYSGAFGNNQKFMGKVLAAAETAGEPAWQMPIHDEYKEQLKSVVADIKNVGGRMAGAITGALFLAEFVGDIPWVHLDIAGTSAASKERGHLAKGATGIPVATLVNLALALE
jgi:leucyl aminopeptidase